MVSKLKTWNDIREEMTIPPELDLRVRQETIKWIKQLRNQKKFTPAPCPDGRPGCCVLHYNETIDLKAQAQADILIKIFNITGEELK